MEWDLDSDNNELNDIVFFPSHEIPCPLNVLI
jgi:hypothetical protein